MKVSEIFTNANMKPVPRAKNLDQIGYCDGYLLVRFKGKPTLWIYGPNISAVEVDKILANPFPDSLFYKVIRAKYRAHKATA
jgi:hypothetical protein